MGQVMSLGQVYYPFFYLIPSHSASTSCTWYKIHLELNANNVYEPQQALSPKHSTGIPSNVIHVNNPQILLCGSSL